MGCADPGSGAEKNCPSNRERNPKSARGNPSGSDPIGEREPRSRGEANLLILIRRSVVRHNRESNGQIGGKRRKTNPGPLGRGEQALASIYPGEPTRDDGKRDGLLVRRGAGGAFDYRRCDLRNSRKFGNTASSIRSVSCVVIHPATERMTGTSRGIISPSPATSTPSTDHGPTMSHDST